MISLTSGGLELLNGHAGRLLYVYTMFRANAMRAGFYALYYFMIGQSSSSGSGSTNVRRLQADLDSLCEIARTATEVSCAEP
jgi:hypothetical protein